MIMKETFDNITMNSARQDEIRSKLMAKKKAKKTWLAPVLAVAAALAIVMIIPSTRAVVVNAAEKLKQLVNFNHNGVSINIEETYLKDENGVERKGVLADFTLGVDHEPFAQVKDGRLYFVLDGKWTDITDKCSENDYFRYEEKGANGNKVVIFVGGTPKDYGWCVAICNKDASCSSVNYSNGDKKTRKWLKKAIKDNPDLKMEEGTDIFMTFN